jgi:hypothetical protein
MFRSGGRNAPGDAPAFCRGPARFAVLRDDRRRQTLRIDLLGPGEFQMRRLFFAVFAAAFIATPAVADQLIESWDVNGWEGGAYRNAGTGEVYCALWDDYGRGTGIWFGWDSTGFYMNLTDPEDFNFQPETTFWTSIRIDQRFNAEVEAYVMDPTSINIAFAVNRRAIDAMRSGEKLYFDMWEIWYTLNGSDAAITAIETCYRSYN